MLNENKHIDELFSNYLSEYEEEVPLYLWNNIQSDLKRKQKLRKYTIIRAIAASVALLLTFGIGYYSSNFTLRKKYEARYLNLNTLSNTINSDKNRISEDSVQRDNEDSINPSFINASNRDNFNEIKVEQNNSRGLIYKLFDLSKEIFFRDSEKELNTNQLAQNKQSSEESMPNQLLIDTLLLEKENLHEGGFLLTQKKEKESKWSFGTKFSPVYSMSENGSSTESTNPTVLKSIAKNDRPNTRIDEKALLAFSGGFNVNYHLTKRWSLESGLFYSQRRQMAENLIGSSMDGYSEDMLIYTPEGTQFIQPTMSNMVSGSPEVIGTSRGETYYSLDMNYISNFEYLELPILVRYKVIDKKIGLDVLSGVSTNFLIANNSTIVQDENSIWSGQADDISPMLYNATLGLGLNYNFYRNISFNLEPTFRYSILSSESNLVKYPYSFAVFAGFSFRLK